MLCAISGESPQDPVISPKSGSVFERRLIESYLQENGKDPTNGDELDPSELIAVKHARIVKPRPPTLTSIPSLLSVFQNEWDSLALETFNLRQQLTQVRQELSNALYENDAAKRVVTRLQRERDEARDALSKVSVNGSNRGGSGDAMQIDNQELNPALAAKVDETQEKLSKTRRKRPVPEDWVTSDDVGSFAPIQTSEPLHAGTQHVALNNDGDLALFGGSEGSAGAYSLSQSKVTQAYELDEPVTDSVWMGSEMAIATSMGNIKHVKDRVVSSLKAHNGGVSAVAVHPSGAILATASIDKTFAFFDTGDFSRVVQVTTDSALTSAQFHPDGHLFAAGGADGQIKIFDVKTGANAANFEEAGAVEGVDFSENGTWLAAVTKGSTTVSVWDLRKSAKVQELEMGGPVVTVKWDYTGQYLAAAGPGGLTVQAYDKSKKEWSVLLQTAVPGASLAWGSKGKTLVVVNEAGVLTVLGNS